MCKCFSSSTCILRLCSKINSHPCFFFKATQTGLHQQRSALWPWRNAVFSFSLPHPMQNYWGGGHTKCYFQRDFSLAFMLQKKHKKLWYFQCAKHLQYVLAFNLPDNLVVFISRLKAKMQDRHIFKMAICILKCFICIFICVCVHVYIPKIPVQRDIRCW